MLSPDLTNAVWRKSSRSSGGSANCVELATDGTTWAAIRDSKNPCGPALVLPRSSLNSLLLQVKEGGFDLQ